DKQAERVAGIIDKAGERITAHVAAQGTKLDDLDKAAAERLAKLSEQITQQREQLIAAGEQAGDALRQRMALHTMALSENWREQHGKLSELVQALELRTTNLGDELEAHGKRATQVAAE